MAMRLHKGAPLLKVSFQIIHIPLEKTAAQIGSDDWETGSFLYSLLVKEINKLLISDTNKSLLEKFSHISSHDLYMRARDSNLWNQADTIGVGTILRERFEQSGDIDEISNAITVF